MIAFLIRWVDREIAHHPTAHASALIAPVGMVPGVWFGWNGLTVAVALIWGCAWMALFFWRLAVFIKKYEARKRRSDRRKALRAARKTR